MHDFNLASILSEAEKTWSTYCYLRAQKTIKTTIHVKMSVSGVKLLFIVQGICSHVVDFIVNGPIFLDRPHFHEWPYISGQRKYLTTHIQANIQMKNYQKLKKTNKKSGHIPCRSSGVEAVCNS